METKTKYRVKVASINETEWTKFKVNKKQLKLLLTLFDLGYISLGNKIQEIETEEMPVKEDTKKAKINFSTRHMKLDYRKLTVERLGVTYEMPELDYFSKAYGIFDMARWLDMNQEKYDIDVDPETCFRVAELIQNKVEDIVWDYQMKVIDKYLDKFMDQVTDEMFEEGLL